MNLKPYRDISDWRLIEVKEFGILYLEGLVNSLPYRSEKLLSFSFDQKVATDSRFCYELKSINPEFAKLLEEHGILFSNYNFKLA